MRSQSSAGTGCIPAEPEKTPYIVQRSQWQQGTDHRRQRLHEVHAGSACRRGSSTRLVTLGTDGFGRSDNREHLRRHFEVDAESIAAATLSRLTRDGKYDAAKTQRAFAELKIDTEAGDPAKR